MASKAKSTSKKESKQDTPKLEDLLVKGQALLCNDVIAGRDGSISFIRAIDAVYPREFPFEFPQLKFSTEFYLKSSESMEQLIKLNISFLMELKNPKNETFPLAEFECDFTERTSKMQLIRFINEISEFFKINHSGAYVFSLSAQTSGGDKLLLSERKLEVQLVSKEGNPKSS